MPRTGRPSEYTTEIAAEICEWLANKKSLKAFCRQKGKPAIGTVCRWLAQYQEFQDQYAKAKEAQAEAFADEMVAIADDAKKDGVKKATLQIDARKWVVSRLLPKKYGDVRQHKHSGSITLEAVLASLDGDGSVE